MFFLEIISEGGGMRISAGGLQVGLAIFGVPA